MDAASDGYRGRMPTWLLVLTALLLGYVIWRVGMAMVRSFSLTPGGEVREPAPAEPEDVDDLDVYLVCGECGTELKVSRLGELQIPRHCGERMQVVRRPASTCVAFSVGDEMTTIDCPSGDQSGRLTFSLGSSMQLGWPVPEPTPMKQRSWSARRVVPRTKAIRSPEGKKVGSA